MIFKIDDVTEPKLFSAGEEEACLLEVVFASSTGALEEAATECTACLFFVGGLESCMGWGGKKMSLSLCIGGLKFELEMEKS